MKLFIKLVILLLFTYSFTVNSIQLKEGLNLMEGLENVNIGVDLGLPPTPESIPTPDVMNSSKGGAFSSLPDLIDAAENEMSSIPSFIQKGQNSVEKEQKAINTRLERIRKNKLKKYQGKGYIDGRNIQGKFEFPRFAEAKYEITGDSDPSQNYSNPEFDVSYFI